MLETKNKNILSVNIKPEPDKYDAVVFFPEKLARANRREEILFSKTSKEKAL